VGPGKNFNDEKVNPKRAIKWKKWRGCERTLLKFGRRLTKKYYGEIPNEVRVEKIWSSGAFRRVWWDLRKFSWEKGQGKITGSVWEVGW